MTKYDKIVKEILESSWTVFTAARTRTVLLLSDLDLKIFVNVCSTPRCIGGLLA